MGRAMHMIRHAHVFKQASEKKDSLRKRGFKHLKEISESTKKSFKEDPQIKAAQKAVANIAKKLSSKLEDCENSGTEIQGTFGFQSGKVNRIFNYQYDSNNEKRSVYTLKPILRQGEIMCIGSHSFYEWQAYLVSRLSKTTGHPANLFDFTGVKNQFSGVGQFDTVDKGFEIRLLTKREYDCKRRKKFSDLKGEYDRNVYNEMNK